MLGGVWVKFPEKTSGNTWMGPNACQTLDLGEQTFKTIARIDIAEHF